MRLYSYHTAALPLLSQVLTHLPRWFAKSALNPPTSYLTYPPLLVGWPSYPDELLSWFLAHLPRSSAKSAFDPPTSSKPSCLPTYPNGLVSFLLTHLLRWPHKPPVNLPTSLLTYSYVACRVSKQLMEYYRYLSTGIYGQNENGKFQGNEPARLVSLPQPTPGPKTHWKLATVE